MRKATILVLLLFAFGDIQVHANEEASKVSTYLSGMTSGTTYYGHDFRISWSLIKYDGRKIKKWIGGDSYDPPRYVLKKLELDINGTEIPLPDSFYYDIYDPSQNGPFIMDDGKILYLVIKCSDGAGSAQAWIHIKDAKIVKRRIKSFGPDGEYKFRN